MASGDDTKILHSGKKLKRPAAVQSQNDDFPDTLEGFKYTFVDGKMQNVETGTPFEFVVKENDHDFNQRRYEAIGEVITKHVYTLLETEGKLQKKIIPVDASNGEPHTFIFHSDDAFSNSKLIVLIHGSGVVRAGQWSRRLIMNDCLDSGTQLPFIKEARNLGYGVIVLNTNDNYHLADGLKELIRGSENPNNHARYVWKNVISETTAKHIAIIAHSFGGVVSVNLAESFLEAFDNKVFAIAFTDSVHSLENQGVSPSTCTYLRKVGRNWVSSSHSLDSPVRRCTSEEIQCVSAGTEKHEMTSWSSFTSIFRFVEERLRNRLQEDL